MKTLTCPFCGFTPDINDPDFSYPVTRLEEGQQIFRAGCIESAGGCSAEILGDTKEHAIHLWSSRAYASTETAIRLLKLAKFESKATEKERDLFISGA